MALSITWLRRDLRLEDNVALNNALKSPNPVLVLFIFDETILSKLPKNDARVTFLHSTLENLHVDLQRYGSSLLTRKGKPIDVWKKIVQEFDVREVYVNKDYEPYAISRDREVQTMLSDQGVRMHSFKDQVVFEENEVVKDDGLPYTVFTPYKRKWLSNFHTGLIQHNRDVSNPDYYQCHFEYPSLGKIGFEKSEIEVKDYSLDTLNNYETDRNLPYMDASSYLGPHLRFGTVGVRQIIRRLNQDQSVFRDQLIWREFYMQILYHFPHVVDHNFKRKYDGIAWHNDEEAFKIWCQGKTGYPMVDAGMRQLNQTGRMHNRVRMVTASFLCKHLLIDWRWGEAYFAEKLLDYDLAANNGNWQWAAGTGCDAAPYFRVFNPSEQQRKFDPDYVYVKKWIEDLNSFSYPTPMVDHKSAKLRAIETYKRGLSED